MRCLKLDGSKPDARSVAMCLIGSPTDDGYKLLGVDEESDNPFIVQWPDINGCNGHAEEVLPIETLVFDPFAACFERLQVIAETNELGEEEIRLTTLREMECGKFGAWNEYRTHFVYFTSISLDIESACKMDGVEVVEI